MADWTQGRAITDWTDPDEVAKVLALLPIAPAPRLGEDELVERSVAVFRLFGIAASPLDRGIEFGEDGVDVVNQPLLSALEILLARRFTDPREP